MARFSPQPGGLGSPAPPARKLITGSKAIPAAIAHEPRPGRLERAFPQGLKPALFLTALRHD
jgi:hypothetical protein